MLAAPRLIQSAGVSRKELELFQDGGQFQIQKNVDHHNVS
jgi:hypothetical protein